MSYEQILYETRGAAAIVTLNRPEKLNAWTATMYSEVRDAVEKANADPAVAAIVLTGAGRAYCSGRDMSPLSPEESARQAQRGGSGAGEPEGDHWIKVVRGSKPIIGAVNGVAVGVGVTQLLPMDVRIAAEGARFGFAFVRVGLLPELASTYFLAQLVGLGTAQDLCLRAKMIDAQEAYRIGLVSAVVAPDRLLDEALAIVDEFAALPPAQLVMTKQLFAQNATEQNVEDVLRREAGLQVLARHSPEYDEAMAAFREKRPAKYR